MMGFSEIAISHRDAETRQEARTSDERCYRYSSRETLARKGKRTSVARSFFSSRSNVLEVHHGAGRDGGGRKRLWSLRTINVGSSVKAESRQLGSQAKLSSTPLACTTDGTSSGSGEGPPVVSRIASSRSVIPNVRFLS